MGRYASGIQLGYLPGVNEICMARSPSNGLWHRAACLMQVECYGSVSNCHVILVDRGSVELLDIADIRRIPRRFVDFCPFIAHQALIKELSAVETVDDKLADRIRELLPAGSRVETSVIGREDAAYVVSIPQVTKMMIEEGFA